MIEVQQFWIPPNEYQHFVIVNGEPLAELFSRGMLVRMLKKTGKVLEALNLDREEALEAMEQFAKNNSPLPHNSLFDGKKGMLD